MTPPTALRLPRACVCVCDVLCVRAHGRALRGRAVNTSVDNTPAKLERKAIERRRVACGARVPEVNSVAYTIYLDKYMPVCEVLPAIGDPVDLPASPISC